jgi:N-carbamoyl-L-amino-acid hydrolase
MSRAGYRSGERLFDILARETADTAGVTREAYGKGEQFAHDLVARRRRKVGLPVTVDAAGNMYIRLAGSEPNPRTIIVGSHLDSVPMGGNFDGAAGVLTGLAVIVGWQRQDSASRRSGRDGDPRRREQLVPAFLYRSKSALGLLPAYALDVKRSDTGRTLAEHMKELGFKPGRGAGRRTADQADDIRAYIEMHIEQGRS